jgi:hypothetical protein
VAGGISETIQLGKMKQKQSKKTMRLPDHIVTISCDRGTATDEELKASRRKAQTTIMEKYGASAGVRDKKNGSYAIRAGFDGSRNSSEIMDSLAVAMEKQVLAYSIVIKSAGRTITRVGSEKR